MRHILKDREKHRKKYVRKSVIVETPPRRPRKRKPELELECHAIQQLEPEDSHKGTSKPVAAPKQKKKSVSITYRNTGLADSVTVVTVNFKTPDLTFDAVTSFKQFYPDIPYILVDNGGCTKSLALGRRMANKNWVHFISNSENVGHGLALNQGLALVKTPYAFLLDSDTETQKGGFLEKMIGLFGDGDVLAAGWLRSVNISGVAYRSKFIKGHPYVHPYACLLDMEHFRNLCSFVDTNAPAIRLMLKAEKMGIGLCSFPVEEYVWHKVAGTRGMFRGNCHPDTKALPGTWHKKTI